MGKFSKRNHGYDGKRKRYEQIKNENATTNIVNYKRPKVEENQSFKLALPGTAQNSERIEIPIYYDDSEDEILMMILSKFKVMDRCSNLFKMNSNATANVRQAAAERAFRMFRTCLDGDVGDKFDTIQSNTLTINPQVTATQQNFYQCVEQLCSEVFPEEAADNVKDYLKTTTKPRTLNVRQWIARIKTINTYIPLVEQGATSFTDRELIKYVISENIPKSWKAKFLDHGCQSLTTLREIETRLSNFQKSEETCPQEYSRKPHHQDHHKGENKPFKDRKNGERTGKGDNNGYRKGKKTLKNPCRMHKGEHEWADCPNNPRNKNESNAIESDEDNENRQSCKRKNGKKKNQKGWKVQVTNPWLPKSHLQ